MNIHPVIQFSLIISLLFLAPRSLSENLDASSQEALVKTMQLLQNKSQRDAYIKNNNDAKGAGQQMKNLSTSPEVEQKMYELAAEIMKTMTHKHKGDGTAMMNATTAGKGNPEDFASQFTPKQRQMLKEIADQIKRESSPSKP